MDDKSVLQDLGLSSAGADAGKVGSASLNRPADEFDNSPELELAWAIKAYEHAETYFTLISSVDPMYLKLTSVDDEVYAEFVSQFPELTLDVLKVEELKSDETKTNWRNYCNQFKKVEDYNFATLVRLDCGGEYSEKNTILVTRIQFLAIEIARNRKGLNSPHFLKQKKPPAAKS